MMSPCPSRNYDSESLPQDVQVTIADTLTAQKGLVTTVLGKPHIDVTIVAATTTATTTTTVTEDEYVIIVETGLVLTSRSATSTSLPSSSPSPTKTLSLHLEASTGTVLQATVSTTSSPLQASTTGGPSIPTGAIIGVVIAGILVISLIAVLLVLWYQRRKAMRQHTEVDRYETGMPPDHQPALTPYPLDLQPNRHLAGADSVAPNLGLGGTVTTYSQPNLLSNQQYPFAPPVLLQTPQRPRRKTGDTLADPGYF
ncbi:hypothetical protein B0H10DRAFT_2000707 [Mycena sp. CBHHK59/15]|nr:hypothetical protein B0H10DRAFT_2000707 [Mycena sp. CBHHK59/15]